MICLVVGTSPSDHAVRVLLGVGEPDTRRPHVPHLVQEQVQGVPLQPQSNIPIHTLMEYYHTYSDGILPHILWRNISIHTLMEYFQTNSDWIFHYKLWWNIPLQTLMEYFITNSNGIFPYKLWWNIFIHTLVEYSHTNSDGIFPYIIWRNIPIQTLKEYSLTNSDGIFPHILWWNIPLQTLIKCTYRMFNGTAGVIPSDLLELHVRFTTVPFNALSDHFSIIYLFKNLLLSIFKDSRIYASMKEIMRIEHILYIYDQIMGSKLYRCGYIF